MARTRNYAAGMPTATPAVVLTSLIKLDVTLLAITTNGNARCWDNNRSEEVVIEKRNYNRLLRNEALVGAYEKVPSKGIVVFCTLAFKTV